MVLFGWERQFQTAVLDAAPGYGSGLTAIEDNESVRKTLAERTAVANNRTNGTSASGETMTGVTIMGAMTGNVSGTNTRAPVFSGAGSTRLLGGRTGDYGYAPQLVAESSWINSAPLIMESLKGKVVLVDSWTYSCVNCVRTLPYLKGLYETYKDRGLVLLGVHSPEFAFEHELTNVRKASADLGVTWPVVLDNRFAQWRAYGNSFFVFTFG